MYLSHDFTQENTYLSSITLQTLRRDDTSSERALRLKVETSNTAFGRSNKIEQNKLGTTSENN